MARNPIKDQVAIVGLGTTGFTRTSDRSALAMALEASTQAIRDAGLTAADIDGVVSIAEPGAPGPEMLATSLGLTDVSSEYEPFFYIARLVTFGLILIAIIDKNRTRDGR